jgi:phosphonate metabolism protein PhnN/1,5-bisphosphokinase (PRPP-forming)
MMRRSRNPSNSRSASVGESAHTPRRPGGRLVLVIGGPQPNLDVLLTAARRRFVTETRVEFPRRLVTKRRTVADTELSTSRSVFREMDREGGLLLSWKTDGVLHGYPISVREALSVGRMVVLGAPTSIVSEAVKRWPHVRVVRVTVGPEAARLPLHPRTCLARLMGAKLRRRLRAVCDEDAVDARVHYSGDLSAAVRSLTLALLRILKAPEQVRLRADKPRRVKRSGSRRAPAGALPPAL